MADFMFYTQANLNMRASPSTSAAIVSTIKQGQPVTTKMGEVAPAVNQSLQSPHKAGADVWVYAEYKGKKGWVAQKYNGKDYLLPTAPMDQPKSPTDSKKPAAKTPTTQPQAKESSMLPMLLGAGAVVFLILALKDK